MTLEQLRPHVDFVRPSKTSRAARGPEPAQAVVVAIGHFGNFELYARFGQFVRVYKCATTYRGAAPTLAQPPAADFARTLRLPVFRAPYGRRGVQGGDEPRA